MSALTAERRPLELGDEQARELVAYERLLGADAFHRTETRHALLKRRLDCGCWIDGGEPYIYSVWRVNDQPPGVISQLTACEFCSRGDWRG